MEADSIKKISDITESASPSSDLASATTPDPQGAGEQIDGLVMFDDLEELDAKARASARRRKIVTGVVITIGAVVAPLVSLVILGKFSLANLRGVPQTQPTIASPTTTPLSAEQRRVLNAQIAVDLHSYLWNQIPPIKYEEAIAEKAFASVTDANYKDDKTSYSTIRNVVVPHYAHFVALASAVKVETKQVRVAHYLMLTAARLKLMAYQQIAAGEADPDHLGRVGILAELIESRRRTLLYHEAITILAREAQVKVPQG